MKMKSMTYSMAWCLKSMKKWKRWRNLKVMKSN